MAEEEQSKRTIRTPSRILQAIPGLQVLRHYQVKDLAPDALSGLVVCLVLIPSTLAYAELAGSGPKGGIFSALVGTVAYFLFATSRHMNVGPDGAVALLAGVAILPITGGDPAKALIAGAWLAMFTGIILILAAWLRLGAIASFLSTPVLLGYLNGAAVVIIVSQWGKLFGIELEQENLLRRMVEWVRRADETQLPTLAVGGAVLVLLVVAKRLIPRIPPLVPVFFVALACGYFIDFEAMGVAVIGEIGATVPDAVGFSLELDDIATLAVGALGLSMLIFPEGVLLGRAMAEKHDYPIDPNRELVALGSANIASALFQGFTIGGSQTRTLLNSASGGRTQVANLASAVFLLGFALVAGRLLAHLPNVAIAAILIYTGFGLISVAGVREMWGRHRQTAWIAILTTAAVVLLGVLPGILLGTAFSLAIVLAQLARPQDALLGRLPGSRDMHDVGDDEQAKGIPGLVVYRFYGPLLFANIDYFIERLQGFIDREEVPVQQVLLDARAISGMDYTAAEKLRPFLKKLRDRGIELAVAKAHLPLRESPLVSNLREQFPEQRRFAQVSDAVAAFQQRRSTTCPGQ